MTKFSSNSQSIILPIPTSASMQTETYYESLRVHRTNPGTWEGNISGNWMIGQVVSGGYVTALALECATKELAAASVEPPPPGAKRSVNAHPDVLTANAHFMSSVYPGPFRADVSVLKSGRTTSTLALTLWQGEKLCLQLLVTCGDIEAARKKGPNLMRLSEGAEPPELPPLEECVSVDPGDIAENSVRSKLSFLLRRAAAERYEKCRSTRPDGSFDDEVLLKRESAIEGGRAEYDGYCFFQDGSDATLATAPVFLDGSVPSVLGVYITGWVPSINWTVQFRCHPSKGPLRFRLKTSHVYGGFLEEDGELWDADGNLVALSRQLAMVGVSQKKQSTPASSKI